jgi:hypothetical protein
LEDDDRCFWVDVVIMTLGMIYFANRPTPDTRSNNALGLRRLYEAIVWLTDV